MGNVPAVESSCRKEKEKKKEAPTYIKCQQLDPSIFFCIISQIVVELSSAPKMPNSQI